MFEWLNKESRIFLKDYLVPGETPEQRIKDIADHAEKILGIEGFSDKFYDYMGRGFFSLASPVWSNFARERGCPISCLTGDSWINTEKDGGKQIQDIEVGDRVLTHKGRYMSVTHTQVRMSNDDIYELKVQTRKTPIKITGNHPVLTNLGWVRVDELDPSLHFIATNTSISYEEKDYFLEFDDPKKENGGRFSARKIKSVKVDEDIAWFLGLWFAEGSQTVCKNKKPNGLRVTMGEKYRIFIDRWLKIAEDKFGVNGNIYKSSIIRNGKENTWLTCNINSIILANKFKEEFGVGCKNKNISLGIKNLPKELLKIFFEAFYLGDGTKTNPIDSFTIANPKLAMSLYDIGLKCGYRIGLQMQQKAGKLSSVSHVYKVSVYQRPEKISLSVNNYNAGIILQDGNRYCPFQIKKLTHNEKVYDITVEKDHSFSVSGVVVHNCFNSHISDNTESIIYGASEVSMMTKLGGGTSGYFGSLRPAGAPISSGGVSDGPVSFIRTFDTIVDVWKQAQVRRGSFAAYLPIYHNDIKKFLKIKHTGNKIQNVFPAVTVPSDWLESMVDGDSEKRKIWALVLKSRIETGLPYVMFSDNVNEARPQVYKDNGLFVNASNLCVAGDQRVPSNKGLLTAKELYELKEPLTVWNNEKEVESTPMELVEKNVPTYKVTLDNGMSHTITDYHKVVVRTSKSGDALKIENRMCKDLQLGDLVKIQTNKGLFGSYHAPKEAFLLGLYQSDGTQNKDFKMIDIWENDFDLEEEIKESVDYLCDKYDTQTTTRSSRIYDKPNFCNCNTGQSDVKKRRLTSKCFTKMPLDFEKGYIPDWIWEADETTQWQYVRGLLYADGTVSISNSGGNPLQIAYTDIKKSFLEELQILFANLGLQTSIRILRKAGKSLLPDGKGGNKYYNTKDAWRLIIGNKNDALAIEKHTQFLTRKGIKLDNKQYRDNTKKFYKVVSIERQEDQDVYCLKVDSKDHLWCCNGFITHNCNEIMLNSDDEHSFVCCLSSVNLYKWDEIEKTDAVETLTIFLDAVLEEFIQKSKDIPYMERAYNFSVRERAIGLGILGWHSYLQENMIPFESMEAKLKNAKISHEIKVRTDKASRFLAQKYGEPPLMKGTGYRNSHRQAIAPTTSSSFILEQVSQSLEPFRSNYYIKALAKGRFTIKNPKLTEILQAKNKNTDEVWNSILKMDGSVQHLDFLSEHERAVFKTFKEISQKEVIIQAAQRQKFVDQGQSLNLLIDPKTPTKDINKLMLFAWENGIKGLYYQHSINAAQEHYRNLNTCKSCEA